MTPAVAHRSSRTAALAAALRALAYAEDRDLRGWDPYDALTSPLFRLPVLRSAKLPRLAAQQLVKRSAVNMRRMLVIPEGRNPVTLALVVQAHAYLAIAQPERGDEHRERSASLIRELEAARTPGYAGSCWGYDFDWEARYAKLPAGTPTVVATGLVTNALYVAYELLGDKRALELCRDAVGFVLHDLNRSDEDDASFCWSYSPVDNERVLNASAKAARLLAQVADATGDRALAGTAARAVRYVSDRQRPDGGWPYAVGDARSWADNFHTAYVLDCLHEVATRNHLDDVAVTVARGWRAYRSAFFLDGTIPKYYDAGLYPIDATACGQALLTLCRFGDLETARRCAAWAVETLQEPDGGFAYQVRRRRIVRIPYMRWSTATMLVGLARVAAAERAL